MRGKTSNSCRSAKLLPYIGAAFLATSAIALVGTTNIDSAHATDFSVDYSVTIEPVMTLSVSSSQLNILLNPVAGQTFGSQNLNVTVATNNEPGYEVYMSADSTDLTHNTDSTEKIATLPDNGTTGYTEATFVDDKWGYKIGDANYFPFVSGDMVDSYEGATNGRTTTLGFAAKATSTKPAGTYTNTLDLSLVPKVAMTEMQNLDPTLCTSTPTVVSDTRDGNLYTIARLADGSCWMLDNMRLDLTAVSLETLQGKTNADNQTLAYLKNGGGTGQYPASGVVAKTTDGGNWADNMTLPYIATSGVTSNNTDWNKDMTVQIKYGDGSGKIGVYYNYCAASAGSYCYASNTSSSNASQDICPTGWKIPSGGVGGQYQALYLSYPSNETDFRNDISATLSGYFSMGSGSGMAQLLDNQGKIWASTYYGGYAMTYMHSLIIDTSTSDPSSYSPRSQGLTVRCILKEGPSNISQVQTMQELGKIDFKTEVLASMDTSTAYTLKDERDNKYYKVAKLADGRVWMTTSLNLAGGTKLYSETSDVPAGYPESGGTGYFTLPASSTSGFSNDSTAYVYNAPNKNNPDPSNPTTCTPANGSPCDSYYSWLAATADGKDASGSVVTSNGYNATYSVCPKGWRLPTATTSNAPAQTSPNWKTGDNYKLATAYGANLESNYYENSATFYNNAGPGTLPNFLLAGSYSSGSFNAGGSNGYYWSSSSLSSTYAYYLYFNSSYVYSANSSTRRFGFPVRCLLR